jgi:hypothetical protein
MKQLLVVLTLAFTLWGCSHKAPELQGAVHKDAIPVYRNSEPDPGQALAGAEMGGEDGMFYGKYFDLKTTDSDDKVLEFYKKALPGATESKDEYGTTYRWTGFPGAEKGEYISVRVKDGLIHIVECLKQGKHKRD